MNGCEPWFALTKSLIGGGQAPPVGAVVISRCRIISSLPEAESRPWMLQETDLTSA